MGWREAACRGGRQAGTGEAVRAKRCAAAAHRACGGRIGEAGGTPGTRGACRRTERARKAAKHLTDARVRPVGTRAGALSPCAPGEAEGRRHCIRAGARTAKRAGPRRQAEKRVHLRRGAKDAGPAPERARRKSTVCLRPWAASVTLRRGGVKQAGRGRAAGKNGAHSARGRRGGALLAYAVKAPSAGAAPAPANLRRSLAKEDAACLRRGCANRVRRGALQEEVGAQIRMPADAHRLACVSGWRRAAERFLRGRYRGAVFCLREQGRMYCPLRGRPRGAQNLRRIWCQRTPPCSEPRKPSSKKPKAA